ncbi:DDE-type integrase/transposase/recombinase [Aneurinibacillus aneurinilyticus]|nr:DDE-type integrase/transposase/recombinase [Aneurinibacillus aneurinilyticus]MED0708838.1 DDE-type integrase/transposase/recombinase [Aneurinibacillus aneurinilyticus]MED0726112.1 DDE-type integrase/transposase/recombinase [Aneurinibacillus aneurinilyticus]MED0741088.1 DDE-type integrase/transposase/recombinase [Aneurinibacillus aneurinilyticus]
MKFQPVPLKRNAHYGSNYWEVYSPKIKRNVHLFSDLEYDHWVSVETNPQIKAFCEQPVISLKHLHKKFLDACRTAGIRSHEYPFTTKDAGRRAIERYAKQLHARYFSEASGRHGDEAARHARVTEPGIKNYPMVVRPFEKVQFDGHRIDAILSVTFQTPEGDEITTTIERLWLLVIIDVATRVILGYHISFNKEYSSADVLQCIRNAIVPWEEKEFTITGLKYPEYGGYASQLIPEAKWGIWDEFHYDNGKANLSNVVRERLTQIIGCSINAGPVSTPERRGIIERFFGLLEENGYHRLPNTTGSHPKDPRRKNAEEKAVKYQISSEHIEELTEVLIALYNGTPHEGVNNLTPLEAMQQRIQRGMTIRTMPEQKRDDISFLTLTAKRRVNGNMESGRRPYIQYEGVTYHSQILSQNLDLIGKTLTLLVNIEDLRTIRAFLPDGSEFGVLTASGKWGITRHTLQLRKEITKLRSRKQLFYTSQDDPIEKYHEYLRSSKHKKRERNKLVQLENTRKRETEKQQPLESTDTEQVSKSEGVKVISKERNTVARTLKKTIVY